MYVTSHEGQNMKQKIKAFSYMECSSKLQQNVNELFACAMLSACKAASNDASKKRKKDCVVL